ncbi:hypothetical protein [Brochothrix campestris]|uniref:Uncharacterized protein n=1 Tax=Brochothrix campestris FSL F6-1037 TaxID=1265861 RepID=W7CCP9_9LIST|nr:hypothetical protein [Brochothrix campestris]EUJ34990.1 hypothetical protein BCAMP_12080 [Brochothrix campestris FSL F6-1037]
MKGKRKPNEQKEVKTVRDLKAELAKISEDKQTLYFDNTAIIKWANERLIANYKKERPPSQLQETSSETIDDEYYYYLENVTKKTSISNMPQLAKNASSSEIRDQFHSLLSMKGIDPSDFSQLINEETVVVDVPAMIINDIEGDAIKETSDVMYETYAINKAQLSHFLDNKQLSQRTRIISSVSLVLGLLLLGGATRFILKEQNDIKSALQPVTITTAVATFIIGIGSGLVLLMSNEMRWPVLLFISVPVVLAVSGILVLIVASKKKWQSIYDGKLGIYVKLPIIVHGLILPVLGLILLVTLIVIYQDNFFWFVITVSDARIISCLV